tara:strand:+ start:494 stop:757 length:264 start_codon:yes stop_codon:yes gene_type:complete
VGIDDYKEIGGYGLFVVGATKVIHWCVKKIETTEKYNKDRDDADSDLIKTISGVITENNINQKSIIENQKKIIENQNRIMLILNTLK